MASSATQKPEEPAFDIPGDRDDDNLWLYDIERASATRLTVDQTGRDSYAIWTPDGGAVTFSSDRTGSFEIYERAADGSGVANLLVEAGTVAVPGSWVDDGETLIYYAISPRSDRDIGLLRRDGGTSTFLATEFNEWVPRLSPDGRWLAFMSDRSGENRIYVQRFPDGGRIIPVSTRAGAEPVWARDGSELFYRDGERMMAVEVETATEFSAKTPQMIFEAPYDLDPLSVGNPNYDVGADGRFLMVRTDRLTGADAASPRVTVVLNWAEELRERVPVD